MIVYGTSEMIPCPCPDKQPFCTTCETICDKKIDAACAIYHLLNPLAINHLTCLGLPNGVTVEQFMEAVDAAICDHIIVHIADTPSIDMSGDGSTLNPIKADAIISPDPGNTLSIHPNGLYTAGGGGSIDCSSIQATFTVDLNQQNTVAQDTYDFLSTGDEACSLISPPTGFAVTGESRLSAFGTMEWFTTLTLANTAAVSEETVLIFTDTVENLTAKNGVDYMGIGTHKIGKFIINSNTVNNLSNLVITDDLDVTSGFTSKINCVNVTILGDASFSGTVYWKGGTFLNNTKTLIAVNNCELDSVYAERAVNLGFNGKLLNSRIIYTGTGVFTAVYADNNTINTNTIISGCHVTATGTGIHAISTHSNDFRAATTVTDSVGISTSGFGIYLHCGPSGTTGGHVMGTGLTGRSDSSHGLVVVSTSPSAGTASFCQWMVTNSAGFSKTGSGISLINGNIKGCHGFSIDGAGISVGGSENNSYNNLVTECTGESTNANGIYAQRDIYIIGGTFISMKDNSTGNPIRLSDPNARVGYFIAGAKTFAISPLAYAIKGTVNITARISDCSFLSQSVLTNVLGIDPLITLRVVATDAYGNMR